MSSREELLRLLEPPAEKTAPLSPDEIARGYGSSLPADFIWFGEVYGSGAIADYLTVLAPVPADEVGAGPGAAPMTAEQFVDFDGGDEIDPAYLEPGGLVAWGTNPNNDVAFFSPVGDPESWPIVIRRHNPRSGPIWARYDCGFAEFLLRTFRGELAENPFSGEGLWRNEAP
ncbi:MAG: hypothetical protein HOW97_21200, partial [Catenulispora sp.]|nr:hypothetical protein [Catenulispora sp.]